MAIGQAWTSSCQETQFIEKRRVSQCENIKQVRNFTVGFGKAMHEVRKYFFMVTKNCRNFNWGLVNLVSTVTLEEGMQIRFSVCVNNHNLYLS